MAYGFTPVPGAPSGSSSTSASTSAQAADKADAEKQEEFIERYESLKAELPEDQLLLFMDAVHPAQATKIRSG